MKSLLRSMANDPMNWSPLGGGDGRHRPALRYNVDTTHVAPELVSKFHQLDQDPDTSEWLKGQMSPNRLTAFISDMLVACCMSRTTANGVCQRGGMFVFSTEQISTMLGFSATAADRGKLLDIGAGDGGVTSRVERFFNSVDATEVSPSMQWLLKKRGYTVVEDEYLQSDHAKGRYDCVMCLNVLDRADKPWSLLRQIRSVIKPDGLVVLAIVLPWCPFVEVGNKQKAPEEILPMTGGLCKEGARFEKSFSIMCERVLEPAGFEVVRWSRVPYMSEGSSTHEYYALDDVLVVLRPKQ